MHRLARILGTALVLVLVPPGLHAGSIAYQYDATGRLQRADYGNGRSIVFSYDLNGNLVRRQVVVPAPDAGTTPDGAVVGDSGSTTDAGATLDAAMLVDATLLSDGSALVDAAAVVDATAASDSGTTADVSTSVDTGQRPDAAGTTDLGQADRVSPADSAAALDRWTTADVSSPVDAIVVATDSAGPATGDDDDDDAKVAADGCGCTAQRSGGMHTGIFGLALCALLVRRRRTRLFRLAQRPGAILVAILALAPAARAQLVVPDQYPTIQAAIDAGTGVAHVLVKAGTYDPFSVSGPGHPNLTGLIIEGEDGVIVQGSTTYTVNASQFPLVQLLKLDLSGGTFRVVNFDRVGVVTMEDCTVHDSPGEGIGVYDSDTVLLDHVSVRNTHRYNNGYAVSMNPVGNVIVVGGEYSDNTPSSATAYYGGLGITHGTGGSTAVSGAHFHNNKDTGLYVTSAISVAVHAVEASGNGGSGVLLVARDRVDVTSTVASGNGDNGVSAQADVVVVDDVEVMQNSGAALEVSLPTGTPGVISVHMLDAHDNFSSGAWLSAAYGTIIVENSVVQDNVGTHPGVYLTRFVEATVSGLQVLGNENTSGGGGGMFADPSTNDAVLHVETSLFEDNVTASGGGGLMWEARPRSRLAVCDTVFRHNSTGTNGGGIYSSTTNLALNSSSIALADVDFENNQGNSGAALFATRSCFTELQGGSVTGHTENPSTANSSALWFDTPARVSGVSIQGNSTDFDLEVGAKPSSAVDDYDLDAEGNWWGTTDLAQIAARIRDRADLSNRMRARYVQPLGAAPAAMGEGCHLVSCLGARMPLPVARDRGLQPSVGDPVDAATGELLLEETDLAFDGPLPLVWVRHHRTWLDLDALADGPLGNGWRHGFEYQLNVQGAVAVLTTPRGQIYRFIERDDGSWTLPDTEPEPLDLYLLSDGTLVVDPLSGQVQRFDAAGALVSVEDRSGNALTLEYTSGTLTHVEDGRGHRIDLEYSAGALTRLVASDGREVLYDVVGNNLVGVTDAEGGLTQYAYDNSGLLTRITSTTRPDGVVAWTQTFNSLGRVTQQRDGENRLTTIGYNTPSSGITRVTDAASARTHLTHLEERALTLHANPAGDAVTLSHDLSWRLVQITDRMGTTSTVSYDATRRVPATLSGPNGGTVQLQYQDQVQNIAGVDLRFTSPSRIDYPDGTHVSLTRDAVGRVTGLVDRTGETWTLSYNSRGQIAQVDDPAGLSESYTYDTDGNLTEVNGASTWTHDAAGRVTRIAHDDGAQVDLEYDALDRLTRVVDIDGRWVELAYDAAGELVGVSDTTGHGLGVTRDASGKVMAIVDRAGRSVDVTRDAVGRVATLTDAAGTTWQLTRNSNGAITEVTDSSGQVWALGRDAEGRVVGVDTPLGRHYELGLDLAGSLRSVSGPRGHLLSIARDALGQVESLLAPDGMRVAYTRQGGLITQALADSGESLLLVHDAAQRLAQLIDPLGSSWGFELRDLGGSLRSTDPLGRSRDLVFNARGQVESILFADAAQANLSYDHAGRLAHWQSSDGSDLTLAYDDLGRLTQAGDLSLSYNAVGQPLARTHQGVTVLAGYDDGRRLESLDVGGVLTVTYTYDTQDRLVSVSDDLGGASMGFEYDDDGRLVRETRSNGVATDWSWDTGSRLLSLVHGSLATLAYAYDEVGRVTGVDVSAPLDAEPSLVADDATWSHDAASQIVHSSYGSDARGRAVLVDDVAIAYDDADLATHLGSVELVHDALGNLVERVDGAVRVHLLTHPALGLHSVVAERDADTGLWLRFYVLTPGGRLLYSVSPLGEVRFYHGDRSGHVLLLSDGAGAVSDAYAYSPYGRLLGHVGSSDQPYTYAGLYGGRRAGVGELYHMGDRLYDAASGRFLTRDAIWPGPALPWAVNPYSYAYCDPIRLVDTRGTSAVDPASPDRATPLELMASQAPGLEPAASDMLDELAGDNASLRKWLRANPGLADLLAPADCPSCRKALSVAPGLKPVPTSLGFDQAFSTALAGTLSLGERQAMAAAWKTSRDLVTRGKGLGPLAHANEVARLRGHLARARTFKALDTGNSVAGAIMATLGEYEQARREGQGTAVTLLRSATAAAASWAFKGDPTGIGAELAQQPMRVLTIIGGRCTSRSQLAYEQKMRENWALGNLHNLGIIIDDATGLSELLAGAFE
ncbi:MAG: DUF6531 domain-containing protein [Pseudomonadota bacterium]